MMKHQDICITSVFVIGSCVALGFGIAFLVNSFSQVGYSYNLWYWNIVYCVILALSIINQLVKWFMSRTEVVDESDSSSDDGLHKKAHKHGKRLILRHIYSVKNPVDTLIAVAVFGMFIWGCYIYAHLGGDGSYTNDAGIHIVYNTQLWVWFQVFFWLIVAILCLTCCCLSCVGCVTCCAVITKSSALDELSKV